MISRDEILKLNSQNSPKGIASSTEPKQIVLLCVNTHLTTVMLVMPHIQMHVYIYSSTLGHSGGGGRGTEKGTALMILKIAANIY